MSQAESYLPRVGNPRPNPKTQPGFFAGWAIILKTHVGLWVLLYKTLNVMRKYFEKVFWEIFWKNGKFSEKMRNFLINPFNPTQLTQPKTRKNPVFLRVFKPFLSFLFNPTQNPQKNVQPGFFAGFRLGLGYDLETRVFTNPEY